MYPTERGEINARFCAVSWSPGLPTQLTGDKGIYANPISSYDKWAVWIQVQLRHLELESHFYAGNVDAKEKKNIGIAVIIPSIIIISMFRQLKKYFTIKTICLFYLSGSFFFSTYFPKICFSFENHFELMMIKCIKYEINQWNCSFPSKLMYKTIKERDNYTAY